MRLMWQTDQLKKIIEKVLLNRIKSIGDDDQTYYKYPSILIDELAIAIDEYLNINV